MAKYLRHPRISQSAPPLQGMEGGWVGGREGEWEGAR